MRSKTTSMNVQSRAERVKSCVDVVVIEVGACVSLLGFETHGQFSSVQFAVRKRETKL